MYRLLSEVGNREQGTGNSGQEFTKSAPKRPKGVPPTRALHQEQYQKTTLARGIIEICI
ncbi:hypothetical protein [Moorena producens]|uniref:hypothetical protein n=1 Tax=Moorena producens TaxID=1155739 RepID=UPI003C76FFD9